MGCADAVFSNPKVRRGPSGFLPFLPKREPRTHEIHFPKRLLPFPRATDGARSAMEVAQKFRITFSVAEVASAASNLSEARRGARASYIPKSARVRVSE